MSGAAMSWAANSEASGPLKTTQRLVLIAMAEPADVDGRRSFLSVRTIARRTDVSERQVARIIRSLEESGHIRRADNQGPAAYLRADQRPVVYDLAMKRLEPVDNPPRGDTDDMSSKVERGDTQGRHGVSPVTDEPTTEPTYGTTPQTPHGPHGCEGGWLQRADGLAPCPTCRPDTVKRLRAQRARSQARLSGELLP